MSSIAEDIEKDEKRYKKLKERDGLLKDSCPFCFGAEFIRTWEGGDAVGDGLFLPHEGNPGYSVLTCKGCHEEFPDDGREAADPRRSGSAVYI